MGTGISIVVISSEVIGGYENELCRNRVGWGRCLQRGVGMSTKSDTRAKLHSTPTHLLDKAR